MTRHTAEILEIADEPHPEERRKGRLHTQTTDRLRGLILTGELPPGARLLEVKLCRELGVSRTPVREAFRTLAAEGLVDLLPNRSVVVAPLHAPDIEHLYRVFGTLEGLAGELACANVTAEEIAEIGRLLSEMVDLHERCERAAYLRINQRIHLRMIEIAANPILQAQWQALVPRVERARALANLDRERWGAALLEHSKMFAALAARDGPLLARLSREHFMNGLPSAVKGSAQAAGKPPG